jgi:hypothetical protein
MPSLCIFSAIALNPGSKTERIASKRITSFSLAAVSIAASSLLFEAIVFSHSTCFLPFSSIIDCAACKLLGLAT